MKEIKGLETSSALREKIALWENRKESSFSKSGPPDPRKSFLSAFGSTNKTRGSKERSDGRPREEVPPPHRNGASGRHEEIFGLENDPGSPDDKLGLSDFPESAESTNGDTYYPGLPEEDAGVASCSPRAEDICYQISSFENCIPKVQNQLSKKAYLFPMKENPFLKKDEDPLQKKEELTLTKDDPLPYRLADLHLPARNEAVCNFWKNQTLKLELDMKEEKVSSLTRELNDLNFTGKAEEEVAVLKKAKHDLELRVKDQEEELDDLAGQVQMLESARVRLEMSIEQMRKENRKELAQRDEELEEVRMSAQKKIKALESQLESEHEERTGLVREKHDLERRLVAAHSRSFTSVDEDSFHRVKKELKKTKALLKDTQTMLEKSQSEGSNKLLMRQLKTQLEDAEFAKNAAIKARQSTESDFAELQNQLEEALRVKKDTEDKLARATKEKSETQTQLEESEEEVAEVMKKYKATVSQLSVDQINISEQAQLIADLEHDKQVLQDKLTELSSKVEVLEGETANIHTQRRLQMKIKEVESKLDLELTTRQRLESQITRLKDQVERMGGECDSVRMKEAQAVDHSKKLNRQLREAKEDVSNLQQKLTDSTSRKQEVEKQFELAESEIITLKSDLKLAFKRIEDLQQALQGDLSDSDSEISESGSDSDLSLTSFLTASTTSNTQRTSSNTPLRTPPTDKELESKHDMIAGPTINELMSVIKEDAEEGYKESFA